MFKIGEFARLSCVSIKTLHHYDSIGLLRPAQVDRYTGYRFYTAAQFGRLVRILALRELGLSLEQVATLLDQDLSGTQIEGMLLLKRTELREEHATLAERLARIDAQLQQIRQEGTMSKNDIVVKAVEPLRVAIKYGVIPSEREISATLSRMFDETEAAIKKGGARMAGPPIALWLEQTDPAIDFNMKVATAYPTTAPLGDDGVVQVEELPAVAQMACLIHEGPLSGLQGSYGALMGWIEQHEYRISGPNRELYLHYERESDGHDFVTELQIPVVKAS